MSIVHRQANISVMIALTLGWANLAKMDGINGTNCCPSTKHKCSLISWMENRWKGNYLWCQLCDIGIAPDVEMAADLGHVEWKKLIKKTKK